MNPINNLFIPCEKFRFSLNVSTLMVLPPYKGAVFRDRFGAALRHTVCAEYSAECQTCLLNPSCLYAALFEPRSPPEFSDAARFNKAPPPYVLNPPLTNRQVFHPGDTLDLDLVLLGPAVKALPYLVYAFVKMGKTGLGRERGKYDLTRVDLIQNGSVTRVYNGQTQNLSAYSSKREETSVNPQENPVEELTLHFLTPLRLKEKGSLATTLTFPLFFSRLAQRITLLNTLYGSTNNTPDFSTLIEQAHDINITANNLHWYEWERRSGRQKTSMKLGGLRGKISFTGQLTPFMPFIELGRLVNVGQGTSFGLGRFEVEIPLKKRNGK